MNWGFLSVDHGCKLDEPCVAKMRLRNSYFRNSSCCSLVTLRSKISTANSLAPQYLGSELWLPPCLHSMELKVDLQVFLWRQSFCKLEAPITMDHMIYWKQELQAYKNYKLCISEGIRCIHSNTCSHYMLDNTCWYICHASFTFTLCEELP
jgi:hypothetical protein